MHTMRTTIDLDRDLLREAMQVYHVRSAKAAVNAALQAAVRQERRRRLRSLLGQINLDLDLAILEEWRNGR
jgi:Arc/MetJ family transcription regulator